jgi:hypothetical protein
MKALIPCAGSNKPVLLCVRITSDTVLDSVKQGNKGISL